MCEQFSLHKNSMKQGLVLSLLYCWETWAQRWGVICSRSSYWQLAEGFELGQHESRTGALNYYHLLSLKKLPSSSYATWLLTLSGMFSLSSI